MPDRPQWFPRNRFSAAPSSEVWIGALLLFLGTVTLYSPALGFPFFPFWDDDIHVHSNPHFTPLTWQSVGALWAGPWQQLYIPLTYTTWAGLAWASRAANGQPLTDGALSAAWFHGANILLHAVATMLAFVLIRKLLGKFFPATSPRRITWSAFAGAAIFACHPLQVEPVAWISGLRDVLGAALAIGALVILFANDRPTPRYWLYATMLFAASLAAKPAAVALPLAAALLAAFPFRWRPKKIAAALLPWLVLGLIWVLITSRAQWAAALARDLVPIWTRPLVALDSLAFYLGKVIWPVDLAADYGRAPDHALTQGWLWYTWILPVTLTVLLASFHRTRLYLVPWGLFVIALAPTLGLVPFNFQIASTVADRYAYLALLGPALGIAMLVTQNPRWWGTGAALVIIVLVALTAERLPLWSDDLRLFADTLRVNPSSWKARHNYASALDDRGRTTEAVVLMEQVIAQRPDSAEAYNDLAVMRWTLGQQEQAIQLMRRSLQLRPTPASAGNLAIMEAAVGNEEGRRQALQIQQQLQGAP